MWSAQWTTRVSLPASPVAVLLSLHTNPFNVVLHGEPSTTDFERTSANSRLMQNGDTHGPVAMRPSLLESLTVLQPHLSPEVSSTFQRGELEQRADSMGNTKDRG
jgi:hypothetical protein